MLPSKHEVASYLKHGDLAARMPLSEDELQQRIWKTTHTLQDVIDGKTAVGVEGRGGKDVKEARKLGMFTTEVFGFGLFAKTEEDAKPMLDFLGKGGKYGTPEFSRLLGYTPQQVTEYLAFMEEAGKGDHVYQIFCDMDGVLVDFIPAITEKVNTGFRELANRRFPKVVQKAGEKAVAELGGDLEKGRIPIVTPEQLDRNAGLPKLRNFSFRIIDDDIEFWASLPWTPDGKRLWKFLKPFSPIILTSPVGHTSVEGKRTWVLEQLGEHVPFITEHDKFLYAGPTRDGRIGFLVDDTPAKVVPFIAHGGRAVLHRNTAESVEQLKAAGFKRPRR